MPLIKFKNSEPMNVILSHDLFDRIIITFHSMNEIPDENILVGGFKELNEHNFLEQANHSDMNYIYRKLDNGLSYILTKNKNDVYMNPLLQIHRLLKNIFQQQMKYKHQKFPNYPQSVII